MLNRINFASFLVTGVLAVTAFSGCHSKPVAQTTTHTDTTQSTDTGEVKKSDVTTTTTQQKDGTQTVDTTEKSTHTVPPPGK